MPALKIRDLGLSVKSIEAGGRFTGYASVWDAVDTYREKVARGAFAESLDETAAKGRKLPILWQHRTDEPIGAWTKLEEDDRGLYGEGELWLEDAPYARIAHRGLKSNAISGLSIGYYVREDAFDEKDRVRTLKKLDLREVSIVTDPALEEARVDTIKAKLAAGEKISTREFARVLRERGFSRMDADDIAAVGFKTWAAGAGRSHQANSPAELGDLAKALRGLSLPTI